MGFIRAAFKIDEEDSSCVTAMREAGAIPFVKSCMPMGGAMETASALWGYALNPLDPSRTPGGSSGGEGALLSAGCSPLGLGSDQAGSIRIPSSFCGVVGIKPTDERITSTNVIGSFGKEFKIAASLVNPVFGPMARNVDDLAIAMRALCKQSVYESDPLASPIPWREELYSAKRKLKIGYYCGDQYVTPTAVSKRAMAESVERLRAQGHELVEFILPFNMEDLIRTSLGIILIDNMELIAEAFDNEIVPKYAEPFILASKVPNFLLKLAVAYARSKEPRQSVILNEKQTGLDYL